MSSTDNEKEESKQFRMQVEQARFLVPPFTLGQAAFDTSEVQAQQEQLPGTPEQAGGGTRSILAHLRCRSLGFSTIASESAQSPPSRFPILAVG